MRVKRRHDDVTMIGLSKETERGTAGYCNRYVLYSMLMVGGEGDLTRSPGSSAESTDQLGNLVG